VPIWQFVGLFVLKKAYILEDLKYDSANHFLSKNDPKIDNNEDHQNGQSVALTKSLSHLLDTSLDNFVVNEMANSVHKRRRLRSLSNAMRAIDDDLAQLMTKNSVQYDAKTSLICIPNFLKYNPIRNPSQRKAAIRQLKELPKSPLTINHLDKLRAVGVNPGESFFRSVQAQSITESISKPEPESESETIKKKKKIFPSILLRPSPTRLPPEGCVLNCLSLLREKIQLNT
jgi:hypothetical protein